MKKIIIIVLCLLATAWIVTTDCYADTIYACVQEKTGFMRLVGPGTDCKIYERMIYWNTEGPQGPAGPQGPPGVANGISTAIHGFVPHDVADGFSTPTYTILHLYTGTYTVQFNPSFPSTPDCTVSLGRVNSGTTSPLPDTLDLTDRLCWINHLNKDYVNIICQANTVNIPVEQFSLGCSTDAVCDYMQGQLLTAREVRTDLDFTFICVY